MKKYFKHFAVLFIITAVMLVVYIALSVGAGKSKVDYQRNNSDAPAERVYDYADVLSDSEEDKLRELIAEKEEEIGCDIVLVTIDDPAIDSDNAMMNYADDFYDQNYYGYNKVHGDGALYLDNWANGYCWFSTCGRVMSEYSNYEIDGLIEDVCENVNLDQYGAYKTYVNSLANTMSGKSEQIPFWIILLVAAIATAIYVIVGVINNKGKKTTTASTYVAGGNPVFRDKRDIFVTKHVTKRRIESSSGGGGGGHISSGGVSHGGGGGRH